MGESTLEPELCVALVTGLPDGVLVATSDLRIEQVNPAASALLGYPAEALIGRPLPELYWDETEGKSLALADRAAAASSSVRALRTAAGARRVFLFHALDVADRLVIVIRDAGDLHDTLDRLARSESSFRAVIDRSPDSVCVHHQGRIVYVNRRMRELWGGPLEELIGRPVIELVHPDDRPMVSERMRALAAGQELAPYIDERLIRRDGSVWVAQVGAVSVLYEGKPSVLVVARDVTQQRQLQTELAQVDRMVALGTLAAGVAHEIGNPLTYVMLRLDAASMRATELRRALAVTDGDLLPIVDELAGHVAAVIDGARRVRTIVSELKVFAHPDGDDEPRPIDVTVPLERALTMAAHELKGLELTKSFVPCKPVFASDGKLTQVFLNLLLNAVHAIRVAGPGAHQIRIDVWPDGPHTMIAVADTGAGIAPEDVSRVFDPFYTTKPGGEGVGLGLAITHSIITSISGEIRIDSRPGAGATFTVVLPAVAAAPAPPLG